MVVRLISVLSGNARQISNNFLADTVVESSPPMAVLTDKEICISKSVAVNTILSFLASNKRLERIGNVCRLSTILLTEERGFKSVSLLILMFMVLIT